MTTQFLPGELLFVSSPHTNDTIPLFLSTLTATGFVPIPRGTAVTLIACEPKRNREWWVIAAGRFGLINEVDLRRVP